MLNVNFQKRFATDARRQGAAARSTGEAAQAFMLEVEFVAPAGVSILFGASGSGKTLTLKAIAGLLRPDAGRIENGGRVLFDSARGIDLPIRARSVGYVFQHLALLPHLSALGNIEFALSDVPRVERQRRALELLERFRVGHVAARRPRLISGGEAQRVALARALAARPRLLLLDEPLSALDEATKQNIVADLKEFNRELRLPILYVTHSRDEALTLGARLFVYERGRVVAAGEPADIFGMPSRATVARLTGVENIFAGCVLTRDYAAGTMTVRATTAAGGSCQLEVPLGEGAAEGTPVVVAVRSGDVLIAAVEPRLTSARNVLRGRIVSLEEQRGRVLARVLTDTVEGEAGAEWAASVTGDAVRELGLEAGREVWLAIKTYSCHLLDEG